MTLKEVLQKFEKLPEEKKRFLSSPVVLAHVEELESKYGIKLALVLMEVVVDEKKDDLVDFLIQKLHLEEDKAKKVSEEIEEKILNEFNDLGKVKKEVNVLKPVEINKVNFIESNNPLSTDKSIVKPKKPINTSFTRQIDGKQEDKKIKKNDILAPPPPVPIIKKINSIKPAISRVPAQQNFNKVSLANSEAVRVKQFIETKKPKTTEPQIDAFDKDDEREIKKIQNNVQLGEPITDKVNWNKEAEIIIKNLNINIEGDLSVKLINILSSTLRGVRSAYDSRDILRKRIEDGGVGLGVNLIDNILGAIKHRKKMIDDIHSGVKLPSHIFVLSGDGEPMIKKERNNISPKKEPTLEIKPMIKKELVEEKKILTPLPKVEPINEKKDKKTVVSQEKKISPPPTLLIQGNKNILDNKKQTKKKRKGFGFLFSKKSEKKSIKKSTSNVPLDSTGVKTLAPPPGLTSLLAKSEVNKTEAVNKKAEPIKEVDEERKKRIEKNRKEMGEILNKTIEKVLDKNKSILPVRQDDSEQKEATPIKKEELPEEKIKRFREKVPLVPKNDVLNGKKPLTSAMKSHPVSLDKKENKDEQDKKQIEKTTKEIKKGAFFGLFSKKKKAKKPISKKVKIEDVKKVDMSTYEGSDKHKLIGPIEELEGLSLRDFRNLSDDPIVAINKIEEKINNLEIDSLGKRILGIKAWKKCEINEAYLSILNEAMMKNISFEDVIKERINARISTIDIKEFNAIAEISKKLRF
jgi:hypothetical protein